MEVTISDIEAGDLLRAHIYKNYKGISDFAREFTYERINKEGKTITVGVNRVAVSEMCSGALKMTKWALDLIVCERVKSERIVKK